jgi:hypothetical protein
MCHRPPPRTHKPRLTEKGCFFIGAQATRHSWTSLAHIAETLQTAVPARDQDGIPGR